MRELVTSDIHMSPHPRDEYRWGLWPWLDIAAETYSAKVVNILGDLTEAKDHHPAKLVNRLCNGVATLAKRTEVVILKANHDYIDEKNPFFGFLKHMKGRVWFIDKPTILNGNLYLPHTRHWEKDWEPWQPRWNEFPYIFCHQTFDGAKSENGTELRGIPPTIFKGYRGQAISGDIHSPQRLSSRLLYVGAPYQVRFGDIYNPRVLLLRGSKQRDLHFRTTRREVLDIRTLRQLQKADLESGTQVKIRVQLKRSEYTDWPKLQRDIKALAKEKGWDLCKLSLKQIPSQISKGTEKTTGNVTAPEDNVLAYAKRKKLTEAMTNRGLAFLKESENE